jgi:DNA-binding NarL/FixJ family response regulator
MNAPSEPAAAPRPVVRVLLADDQRLVRESLATLLGLLDGVELVASACDGEEACALVAKHVPDVVLMDLRMPRMDGIEATRIVHERHPQIGVIALTTYADDASVIGVLRAGARGYLTKDASSSDIHAAIHTVAGGAAALDPSIHCHVVSALSGPTAQPHPDAADGSDEPALPDGLTPREAEVLILIADGLTNSEIAAQLVVTPTTVKSHINHLFAKAGLRDRAQAVRYAYAHNLATPPG